MEKFRLRRNNTAPTAAGHSSGRRLGEGNGQVEKRRSFLKLASDSSSRSSDSTNKDLFMRELECISSKQAVGTPIKQLLAEEMLRETESNRRSPSVIARLMGLDGLPSQQSSHKLQRRFSENYLQRMVSKESAQRNVTSCSNRSSRKSSKEEQEFKDVFEVVDTPKIGSTSYTSQGTANSNLTEDEITFIQQKFMDAKLLSTDEKRQYSKEFHDTIEDLDSNKDLLLKFLQQPNSLFTKHLHDLHAAPPRSHCGRISAMKSQNDPQFEIGRLGCKIERDTAWKKQIRNHDDLLSHSSYKHATCYSLKSSKVQFEGKDESTVLPTRIVVLKPNHGKVKNATKTASPCSSHDFISDSGNQSELPSMKNGGVELCGKKKFPDYVEPSRYKSGESREIAKEITRQMRTSFSGASRKISTSGYRGYAGDESSLNGSENESANELDGTNITSIKSVDWGNRNRPRSTESSVSKEAKKRLSERWKMTHKSVDMGVVSRGSTLGEMLSIIDGEVRPSILDAKISNKSDANDGFAGWVEPQGISSRDGWKDGCVNNLSRSRSVPASSTADGSPKMGMHCEALCNDKYMLPKEVMQRERNKAMGDRFNHREGSSSRNTRCRPKKSRISRCNYSADHSDTSPEIHVSSNRMRNTITEDNLSEHNHMSPETSASIVTETSLVPEIAMDVAIHDMVMPSKPTHSESSTYMLVKGNSSTSHLDVSSTQEPSNGQPDKGSVPMQHPATEQESTASSKEADQPSPVSVLETSFPDDLSSGSECFESLNADLHGLRMQLQLLKLESEAYAEGPMLISSDEDVDQEGPIGFSEETGIPKESREFSYIVDVLLESGINDADPNTFITTWHCPECPVSPQVFDELEKKYCSHSSWLRSERKLMFDRINSAVLMIYQQHSDPHPWVRPATGTAPNWVKNELEDCLHKLLASQDKKADEDAAEVLARESLWLDLGDDIDVIGRDIEWLLTEELVKELIAM